MCFFNLHLEGDKGSIKDGFWVGFGLWAVCLETLYYSLLILNHNRMSFIHVSVVFYFILDDFRKSYFYETLS